MAAIVCVFLRSLVWCGSPPLMEGGEGSLDLEMGPFKPEAFETFGELPRSDNMELELSALFI